MKIGDIVYPKVNNQKCEIIRIGITTISVKWTLFGKQYIADGVNKSHFKPIRKFIVHKGEKIFKKCKVYWFDKECKEGIHGEEWVLKEVINIEQRCRKEELFKLGYECQTCRYKKSNQRLRKTIKELKKEAQNLEEQILDLNEELDVPCI